MKISHFLILGVVVGTLVPTALSMCLFGTTVQSFVAGPTPAGGFWSGAPTPVPTPIPSPAQVWTKKTFSAANGAVFLLWSVLGACAGEGLALRRWGKDENAARNAWLGALAGSVVFVGIAVCGFLR